MNRKWIWTALLMAILLLTGCNMRTVEEMYALPKRSEAFTNLQSVMDSAMVGFEYSAPLSGENQQTVQMADLDGDGEVEYILFAKGSAERPLQIFIFARNGEEYVLMDTIESHGTAFEQVEYIHMNNAAGYELVVGRQVSDQVLRSVSVYTMEDGQIEQIMTANYSRFLCTDLDRDARSELFVLRPGEVESSSGVAELYSFKNGTVERSNEVNMSRPADKIKRIMLGRLQGDQPAVYVASDVDESAIITDVYALTKSGLNNVSFSNESGNSVQTLRNYFIYADDIDDDGVLELPSLITMKTAEESESGDTQYIIRWYSLTPDGTEVDKMFTYHNFVGGWYIRLNRDIAHRFAVTQKGNSYEFSLWDEQFRTTERVMNVYVLTGQRREEQAVSDNRFVLRRSESTIYAANLEVASSAYGMSRDSLTASFHLIVQDWNTGMT